MEKEIASKFSDSVSKGTFKIFFTFVLIDGAERLDSDRSRFISGEGTGKGTI